MSPPSTSGASTSGGVGLGFDVGGSAVKWALVDETGERVAGGQRPTPADGPRAVLETFASVRAELDRSPDVVGVALPGHLDPQTGCVSLMPNVAGAWVGFAMTPAVSDRLGLPAVTLNDARALAVAELRSGAAAGRRNVMFCALGTGVGGAVALRGRVLSSDQDTAGEIGHVSVEADGLPCGCGSLGCLETVASAPALVAAAARGVLLGHSDVLTEATGGSVSALTAAAVTSAAAQGDWFSIALVERAGRAIARAVDPLCAALLLDTVVVGGGMAQGHDVLLPAIAAELERRRPRRKSVEVLAARFGVSGGALGAAMYAQDVLMGVGEDRHRVLDR